MTRRGPFRPLPFSDSVTGSGRSHDPRCIATTLLYKHEFVGCSPALLQTPHLSTPSAGRENAQRTPPAWGWLLRGFGTHALPTSSGTRGEVAVPDGLRVPGALVAACVATEQARDPGSLGKWPRLTSLGCKFQGGTGGAGGLRWAHRRVPLAGPDPPSSSLTRE